MTTLYYHSRASLTTNSSSEIFVVTRRNVDHNHYDMLSSFFSSKEGERYCPTESQNWYDFFKSKEIISNNPLEDFENLRFNCSDNATTWIFNLIDEEEVIKNREVLEKIVNYNGLYVTIERLSNDTESFISSDSFKMLAFKLNESATHLASALDKYFSTSIIYISTERGDMYYRLRELNIPDDINSYYYPD